MDAAAGSLNVDVQTMSLDATTSSNLTVTGTAGATDLTISATNTTGTASVLISGKTEIDLTAPNIDINGNADVREL